jgi:hypothetical protein
MERKDKKVYFCPLLTKIGQDLNQSFRSLEKVPIFILWSSSIAFIFLARLLQMRLLCVFHSASREDMWQKDRHILHTFLICQFSFCAFSPEEVIHVLPITKVFFPWDVVDMHNFMFSSNKNAYCNFTTRLFLLHLLLLWAFSLPYFCSTHSPIELKGAQVWDFDVLDFNDFFIMKSL